MFLLMDPNALAEASAECGSVGSNSFHPNPAAATTQLEYEMKKAGPVRVELLNKDGNKLRPCCPKHRRKAASVNSWI